VNSVGPDVVYPRVAVAGAGGMGLLFARLLLPGSHSLLLIDPLCSSDTTATQDSAVLDSFRRVLSRTQPTWNVVMEADGEGSIEIPDRVVPLSCVVPGEAADLVPDIDVLVLSLPFLDSESFTRSVKPYVHRLHPGALVVDTMSLKVAPLDVLEAVVPGEVDILGTHPMFGPAVNDVMGHVIATVLPGPHRLASRWRQWFTDTLVAQHLLLTPCSAPEHDRAMTYVQVLTHFVLLALARCIVRRNIDPAHLLPFRSPIFEPLIYLAARVAVLAWESPETYSSIQHHAADPTIRTEFVAAAQELLASIESAAAGDRGAEYDFETLLVRTGAYWGHIPTGLKAEPRQRIPPAQLAEIERGTREPFRRANIVSVSNSTSTLLAQVRRTVLESRNRLRAVRDDSTGATYIGLIYIDPERHDKVDLSSRVRFRRVNLPVGLVEEPGAPTAPGLTEEQRQDRIEASLSSIPLAHARFLSDAEMFAWLDGALAVPGEDRPTFWGPTPPGSELNRFAIRSTPGLTLRVPPWFDEGIVNRLLAQHGLATDGVTVRRVRFAWLGAPERAVRLAQFFLHCYVHPDTIVDERARVVYRILHPAASGTPTDAVSVTWAFSSVPLSREHRAFADRTVRAAVRRRVDAQRQVLASWLLEHGCFKP